MKFKVEIFLLLLAIALYSISTFCYSYEATPENRAFTFSLSYPYRGYAFPLVGLGSVLVVTATVSYSRRSKTVHKGNQF